MNTPCYTIHLDIFEKNCREVMDAFEEAQAAGSSMGILLRLTTMRDL